MLKREETENESFLSFQVNKLSIFLVLVFFHLVLIFHDEIIGLFSVNSTGNIFISIFLVLSFAFLYFATKRRLFEEKIRKITFLKKKIEPQNAIKLFLAFIIPTSIVGLLLRIYIIRLIPLDVQIADMLPLIQKATVALLQGQNPYQVYYFPYAMPLTFWPGLWMVFLPSFWLGFDPRWIGLALWTIISIVFVLIVVESGKKNQSRLSWILSGASILFLQISFPLVSFQAYGHTFGLWLWLILMSLAIMKKRFIWSAVFLGIVLASRQTAFIYVPLLFAYWVSQKGWVRSAKYLFISVFVFGIIVLPFLIQSQQQFLIAPIQHYQKLGDYAMGQGQSGWTANAIGFSYVIQEKWGADVLSKILGLVALLLATMSFFAIKNVRELIVYAALSVTVFSFFTPIPWMYEYFPALLFLTLALFSEE